MIFKNKIYILKNPVVAVHKILIHLKLWKPLINKKDAEGREDMIKNLAS
jgi:hypothetical protein